VAPDALIDRVFAGRYRVVRKLGTGGMADVYLAEDLELGRRVALKILDERHAQDEQFVARFRREAKNAAGLSHPSIVAIYDRGEVEGTYYIAMEYFEGRTLKQLLVTHGPTPIPIALEYARQILAALGFAHRNGIVHRDIKPRDVLVGPDGRLKVTDFGIARSGTSQMTEAGPNAGTAEYLSPEQARGAPVDQRSDLYSVGVVLYEMLTGSLPFTADTATPEAPSDMRPEVSDDLDLVVLRALAKHPDDRYQSAEEMEADLARVVEGTGVSPETAEATVILSEKAQNAAALTQVVAKPQPPPPAAGGSGGYYDYEYGEAGRRRPVWPRLLALLLVLVAAGLAASYVYTKTRHHQTAPPAPVTATKPATVPAATVPLVIGNKEILAVKKVGDAGLKPHVRRLVDAKTRVGYVFAQDPPEGTKTDKGKVVTIKVSKARPKVRVPAVVGKASYDATAALVSAHLKYKVVQIHSDKPIGKVIGQFPKARAKVVQGTIVRLNVSQAPAPVAVPLVIGKPFVQASSELQAAGFAVARNDVDSDKPKDTVLGESPTASTLQPKASTITLSVSKGPQTRDVPDVTSTRERTAVAELAASGFRAHVQMVDTAERAEDGIVLDQNPPGGKPARPGTKVTIVVGHYKAPPTTTTAPPPTKTAPTTPTTTTAPPTIPTTTAPLPTETAPTTTPTTIPTTP
jgi:eukaryotic-like serine/threonine-protein kinase